MSFLTNVIVATLVMGTSLTFATIGEIFTEKAGVLNLGMEGMMLLGALSGFATVFYSGSLLLGIIVAMIGGAFLALIHSFVSVTMRASQVVSGLAITMFGTGLANFLGYRIGPAPSHNLVGMNLPVRFEAIIIPGLSKIPVIGGLFQVSILTYFMYLLIPISWWFMYRTKYGLAVRAVGENPRTAAAMGINVNKIRYIYTLIGGAMAGLGGACISLYHTPSWNENMTGGKGWIVIALVIFAEWNPAKAIIGTFVFGGIMQLQFAIQAYGGGFGLLNAMKSIPAQFFGMAPYLITFLVLAIVTIIATIRHKQFPSPAAMCTSFAIDDK